MSFTAMVDAEYAATRATPEEESAIECRRDDCDSPIEDTKACDICGESFCPVHLYMGVCATCLPTELGADERLERAA